MNRIDVENTNLLGGNSPDFKIQGDNTGTVPISSVSVQVSGQTVTFTWNTAFPLQPGQSASAETTTLPTAILLVVGDIYQVTITATMSDGTTETQTTSAIYTLGAGLGL